MIEQGCVHDDEEEIKEMRQEIATNTTGLAQSGGGRIFYLDALKCFAILLVIEGHVRTLGMHIKTGDILSGLMFYTFDLPIFFFISGYLAYKSQLCFSEAWKNIRKKFVMLLIPAVVVCAAYHLLNHEDLLYPLYHGFGKYWFTIALFECFLIYYSLLVIIKSEKLRLYLIIALSLLGLVLLSKYSVFGPPILDLNHLCKYYWFFAFGLIAKEYSRSYNRMINNETVKGIAISAFFLILFSIDYQLYPKPILYFLRDIVLRVLGTGIMVSLFYTYACKMEQKRKVGKIIIEIGQKSLPIYLLQYFFIPDFSAFPEWIGGLDTFTIHIIAVIYTIFITVACLCIIYLLELSSILRKYVLGQKR